MDGQKSRLGHFFDGVTQPFAAQPGILHASIRHVVDSERRHLTDHQSADFKGLKRARDAHKVASEDSGLQTEIGTIDGRKRFVIIGEFLDRDHRTEDFHAVHAHVGLGIG